MADQRVAGLIQLQGDGEIYDAKGEFTYGLGVPKREAVIGADGVHGFKETAQAAFIEGALTDRKTRDVKALFSGTDKTITLKLANGKSVVLRSAWYAGDGTAKTGEGEIGVRWEGKSAQEIS